LPEGIRKNGEACHLYAKGALKKVLQPAQTVKELALQPVWFLAYRKDNKVAYAVVNGQTGKAAEAVITAVAEVAQVLSISFNQIPFFP